MKINIEFNSWNELSDFLAQASAGKMLDKAQETAQAAQEAPKKAEPKKNTKAEKQTEKEAQAGTQKAAEPDPHEPMLVPGGYIGPNNPEDPTPAEEPAKEAPKVDESYRVQVRKTLAALNKKTGKNTASELIQGFGVEKLTGVALEDLPALMEKAEEALNA